MDNRYIVVEGVIGAGKTSLSRLLTEHLQAKLVLEEVEENPFLKDFYRDREQFAFQTQMHFLFSRYQQQRSLRQMDLFSERMVSEIQQDVAAQQPVGERAPVPRAGARQQPTGHAQHAQPIDDGRGGAVAFSSALASDGGKSVEPGVVAIWR